MVIDLILDRKDDDKLIKEGYTHVKLWNGKVRELTYNPHKFYRMCMMYDEGKSITYAMDYLENEDVQKALCDYINNQGYNPNICDYINSVDWL